MGVSVTTSGGSPVVLLPPEPVALERSMPPVLMGLPWVPPAELESPLEV